MLLVLAPALRAQTPPFEEEIAAFEAADRRQPPAANAVFFLGSSSIRLWSSLARDFKGLPVVNRGFGGSSIADSTRVAKRIVLPYQPRRIVFYAGDNDIASGRSAAQVFEDFKAFVAAVRAALPAVPISFISIKPCPARWNLIGQVRQANALIRDYAGRTPGLDYIDIFTPMLNAAGEPRRDLFAGDNLHLNAKGYKLWAKILAPRIR
jgi:lysophospholipase L1-like esterase